VEPEAVIVAEGGARVTDTGLENAKHPVEPTVTK
jgi:hypothetical protein